MNLIDTFVKGGPLMFLILACSIVTVAVCVERWLSLRKNRILPDGFINEIKDSLRSHRLSHAIELCENQKAIGVDIISAGLNQAGAPREVIRENLENAGRQNMQILTRGLGVLATVASISPLLGLMGTVTGMIRVFRVISVQGVGDPASLSGGISEALFTTAAGLAVAIPTLILHNYFLKKTEKINLELEKASSDILNLLDTSEPLDTGAAS